MKNEEMNQKVHDQENEVVSNANSLGDEQRVKVLTPAMLVFKRFIRNKLAITGIIILIIMFLFSFAGPLFIPYRQDQVFKKMDYKSIDYAVATYNNELRYTVAEGKTFDKKEKAQMMLALGKGQDTFEVDGEPYSFIAVGDSFYTIYSSDVALEANIVKNLFAYKDVNGTIKVDDAFKDAFESAFKAANGELKEFEYQGTTYTIVKKDKVYYLGAKQKIAVASMLSYDAFKPEDMGIVNSVDFRSDSELALTEGKKNFESQGVSYEIDSFGENVVILKDGEPFAGVSDIIVNSANAEDTFIDMDFKYAAREAITNRQDIFYMTDAEGNEQKYELAKVNTIYYIKTDQLVQVIDIYSNPTREHILGTDANGMDLMARLMYGGRISLLVGFVVVFIELLIGVLMGGVSGYFGGWVDTCIMRFVDLFNCIPQFPMMLILGSILDAYQVDPKIRIYLLMVLLGVLGWTGIARVVRGQILSLREQDFMIATEATGIRVSRRIFRHLVPNVMPLLIVQATMSLGGIIISEATLSFLGLGVKYPLASWGSIINAATDIYVMRYYWFLWIPAGFLILTTVLGFNFVGDGLRDAFDPKMKR